MANCSKCGSEVQGNFCPNCGNPINAVSVQKQSNPRVYTVGNYTYTDEDLKHYERLLNSEIIEYENYIKKGRRGLYIGLVLGAITLIHWFSTTGFWNALITIFIGFNAYILILGSVSSNNHYSSKLDKLKQHNAYTYMMEKVAEANNNEKRMQNIATGIKAANVGLKIYNLFRNF